MKIKKEFGKIIRDGSLHIADIGIRERYKAGSLRDFSQQVLANLNVEGKYLQSEKPEFNTMREN